MAGEEVKEQLIEQTSKLLETNILKKDICLIVEKFCKLQNKKLELQLANSQKQT